jgi:hypothetical protein
MFEVDRKYIEAKQCGDHALIPKLARKTPYGVHMVVSDEVFACRQPREPLLGWSSSTLLAPKYGR